MNQLILLVIFLLLFVWFGGNNVPKFLRDNKNILLGAAGGVEAAYSILCLNNKKLPYTLNLENAIDSKNINFIREKAIEFDINYILSNSFGFGGTNVSLILKKFNESKLQ